MKYLTQKWNKDDDGILYFFQRLEEMLFHYSSDIVRMPVHNSRTLLCEYLINESEHIHGRVKKYQLEQIVLEIKFALQSDAILRENLGESFIDSAIREISVAKGDMIRYIFNKISPKIYFGWCIEYIKKHVEISSHKEEIEKGLKAWVVEVISVGYAPEYIYNYLQSLLVSKYVKGRDILEQFLEHFSLDQRNFRVYFTFTQPMKQCKEVFEKRLHLHFEDDGCFSQIKTHKNEFIGYVDEKSFDRIGAVRAAYANISIFLKYYQVLSNRKQELVRKYGYVKDDLSDTLSPILTKVTGYRSIEVEPTINITNTTDSIILACQSKQKETRANINKILDLHNEAIKQADLNDGFLNLWSILEVICEDLSGESKIEKIINGVVPILKKDYMQEVINNIRKDLKDNMDEVSYYLLLNHATAKYPELDPVTCLIFMPEFDQVLEECFHNELSGYPVIRNKIFHLYQIRNDKTEIKNLYDRYAQRIKWHLYRLYRSRNAIVHSGETPKHIQQLGEHLHIYVDSILLEILIKLAEEPTLKTISNVLIDSQMLLNKIMKQLDDKSSVLKDDVLCIQENYFYKTEDTCKAML